MIFAHLRVGPKQHRFPSRNETEIAAGHDAGNQSLVAGHDESALSAAERLRRMEAYDCRDRRKRGCIEPCGCVQDHGYASARAEAQPVVDVHAHAEWSDDDDRADVRKALDRLFCQTRGQLPVDGVDIREHRSQARGGTAWAVATKVHEGRRHAVERLATNSCSVRVIPRVALAQVKTVPIAPPKCSASRRSNSQTSGPKLEYQRFASI